MTNSKKELLRTIKFTLFSISAGIIQVLSFTLFEELLHWTHWLSYLLSLVLSVLWNFTLNRHYTFHSAANVPLAMLKVAGYYVVFTPASALWGTWLETLGLHDWLIEILNMLINFVTEFLFQKFVVYREKKED